MRIVTRPDFDGIVCAVLLRRAENIKSDIYWTEPNKIQSGTADIRNGDILYCICRQLLRCVLAQQLVQRVPVTVTVPLRSASLSRS